MGVPTVVSQAAFLEINGRRIDGVPLYDGGVTPPEGIIGTFGESGTTSDIGLAYAGPQIPPAFVEYRRTTTQKAIVTVTGGPDNGVPDGLALMNAPSFVEPFGPPSCRSRANIEKCCSKRPAMVLLQNSFCTSRNVLRKFSMSRRHCSAANPDSLHYS